MANSQKILYIITKSNWGGAQRYVFDMAVNLSAKNLENNQKNNSFVINKPDFETIVACGGSGELKTRLEKNNIRVISIDKLNRDVSVIKDTSSFFSIYKIINSEKPDILHLNSPKAGGIGALAGRILGIKKIVYTSHGWPWEEDRSWISKKIIKLFSWLTCILCHKVIVVSKKDFIEASKMFFISKKVIHIPNGIDQINLIPKEEAIIKMEEKTNLCLHDKIVIGTVGELNKNKGHKYLIQAFAELHKENQHIALVIVGEGEKRNELENLVKKMGIKDRVSIPGNIKDVAEKLKSFDIFAFSSVKEGLPYAILESGQAELPIVAPNIGGIPDIIDDNQNGLLFESKNIEDLKNKIKILLNDKNLRSIFGSKIKDDIYKKFGITDMLKKTTEVYLN